MTEPRYGRTAAGEPLDDAAIEALADQAEAGYDVDDVIARRGKDAGVAPQRDIDGMRRAHAGLLDDIAGLTDDRARAPSRLPGWSVGHLLTHLARNADSVTRRLEGAARDEVVDQYPGGPAGRAAEIETGADRPATELVLDVAASHRRLDAAVDAVPADAWGRATRAVDGEERPAAALPFGRWREVEVHRVDLGLGHAPADWPPELVSALLPDVLAGLPDRTEPVALLAWALGRGAPPGLAAWG